MKLEERNTVCLEQDEHGGLGNHGLSLRMGGGGGGAECENGRKPV